jgi:penicillin-binding protein 1A
LNHRGEIIYQQKFVPERAIDEETSAIMTWMLQGVVNEGTGQAAQLVDRQVAGKTGTTDEARDLWFVGYIPQLVTGVWLGNDDNKPTYGKSTTAAYTWNQFMSQVVKEVRPENFVPRPDNLDNRPAKIKVQPIQPKSILYGSNALANSSDEQNSDYTPTRRRRYRRALVNSPDDVQNSDYTPTRRRYRRALVNSPDVQNSDYAPTRRRYRRARF